MSKHKKSNNRRLRQFLRYYFFDNTEGHAIKDCGDWILENRWNGNSNNWEVAIFTKDSYENMIGRSSGQKELTLDEVNAEHMKAISREEY